MYYLSEKTNLKEMDEAILCHSDKNCIFANKILTPKEVYISKKAASRFRNSETKEKIKREIWKNFTVPIKHFLNERSTQSSTPADSKRRTERKFLAEAFHRRQDLDRN